ncbi:Acetyl-/propionyl-coenzyme A carboxylase alpha chain [Streptomyces hundungensis]|uniref:Acetyl-/propionyl-coenzyme A carboxylase alpha chain n=1 Tax=Streptomyces hundungensis TaxID=1077946 RepID=A0A387HFC9_9ACTN|nr:biotin carboxylase N-terminal domain-containing protein [Streptomyces hundungensis]AYG82144.1 Acetyl-/propionyl-coenzyme A carboxylase alpha chain [Streptomyces hundungensis]
MIKSVLVANRGEIACRVFRTCRELGIATVAVFSDADAGALHVREADTAVRLPGATPAETYLRGDLLVAAALASGADAVHPGYGFLSENADFARAVAGAGLTWIGPPPDAIEAMASKTRAKELMGLPPLNLADVTERDLPLLIKASAGGGGRGMRVVRQLADLEAQLTAARAEALGAFGDGDVFVEPYVEGGRHVEVQILADAHGTVWVLGTRDCSLQRRHQKVIEEAPAPGLRPEMVDELYALAVRAVKATDYRGAGTVEFLVAGAKAHFLEMNTRLQVEHPVTEAVFGLDLVALQLRVAEGDALPPSPPAPRGHAIEARLYAEDPANGWAPQTGTIHQLAFDGARLDAGYADGDTIGVHYDPMIAKVVVHGATRAEAARKLAHALERARVHGPATNRDLLVRSLRHPDFTDGPDHLDSDSASAYQGPQGPRLDTGFYDRNLADVTAPLPGAAHAALAAALADAASRAGRFGGGWRNVPSQPQVKRYGEHEVRYRLARQGLEADGHPGVRLDCATPDRVRLEVGGLIREFGVSRYGDGVVYVDTASGCHALTAHPRFTDPSDLVAPGSLLAPMPGVVARVADGVEEGCRVHAGQPLLWLEAMKMEHRISAPASGTLTALHAAPGRQVEVGALLAVVASEAEEA